MTTSPIRVSDRWQHICQSFWHPPALPIAACIPLCDDERLVSQVAGHTVPHRSLLAAAATPRVVVGDPTGRQCPIGLEALSGHLQSEFVEAADPTSLSCWPRGDTLGSACPARSR